LSFAIPLARQALLLAPTGFAALPALSRQLTGKRGSPSATTTIGVDRPQLAKAEIAKLEAAMKAKAARG
jgi:hypothetical protein